MQPFKCPHCGAPPPPGYVPPSGQFGYACFYCRQQSVQGTPEPAPPPPVAEQSPAIIVVHAPSHDYDHHAAIAHVNTARSISWLVWVVVVLVVSLGGSGAAFMRCTKHSTALSSLVWDGSEPLHCGGNEDIAVTGVEAHFSAGQAIVATGNCKVRCTDCKISAPIAIEASGNAQVTIINGSVQGSAILADASGNSRVNISGNATASGQTRQSANGKVTAPPPPVTATASTTAPPATAATAPVKPAAVKPAAAPVPTAKKK
jgi:hypothetical protein